jgi:hypothetical protein
MVDLKRAFERLLAVFGHAAIPYMVGGSLASSAYGISRATNDVNIVARVREEEVARLVEDLGGEFYADPETIREALVGGRPFNLIHFASGYKFDIFPVTDDPYSLVQMERRQIQDIVLTEGESIRCPVATAEDTVLAKLVWYRAGGEQSERQWNDLRGICAMQGTRLDRAFMREWARHLEVEDLLDKLLAEQAKI